MMLVILLTCGFASRVYFKYEVQSMGVLSRLMAHGWSGIGAEDSKFVRCTTCNSPMKRGQTVPYCAACRKYT